MCYMNRALETCWYAAMGSDRTCDIMSAGHLAYRPLISRVGYVMLISRQRRQGRQRTTRPFGGDTEAACWGTIIGGSEQRRNCEGSIITNKTSDSPVDEEPEWYGC